jgi:periplasmic protein TonB
MYLTRVPSNPRRIGDVGGGETCMKGSLPFSAAAHALVIGLLLLLPAAMATPPKLDLSNAVEVVFAPPRPPTPPSPPQPVVEQPPPPSTPPVEEPPPPQPPVEQPPPPPAAETEIPPPPPPKPEPKPKPRPRSAQLVQRESEREIPMPPPTTPTPAAPPQTQPQVASLPRMPAAPVITADYRSLLRTWLETHKHYPEEARQRGEEGRALLRFRVARSGRVLDYAVVSSTGFADLDASVQDMMRGATLPPFPPSMTEPEIEVSVTIRYGLAR